MPANLTHETIVEAMARALFDEYWGRMAVAWSWAAANRATQDQWRKHARAALAAQLQAAGVTAEGLRVAAGYMDGTCTQDESASFVKRPYVALLRALAGESGG